MTTAPNDRKFTGPQYLGHCALPCAAATQGPPPAPRAVTTPLHKRNLRAFPVTDALRAMALLVNLERELQTPPKPLLFIACVRDDALDELVSATRAYCPHAVCRRMSAGDSGSIEPFAEPERKPHAGNGTVRTSTTPGAKPDLRLIGAAGEPASAQGVETHETPQPEPTTLSDDELAMLLSEDWDTRADGTTQA